MQSMETAPKDRKILCWCDHEVDPYWEDGGPSLTLYGAHAEGMGHAETGFHILEWGGGVSFGEDEGGGYLPDWWFVAGSEFEVAANPTHWAELPLRP